MWHIAFKAFETLGCLPVKRISKEEFEAIYSTQPKWTDLRMQEIIWENPDAKIHTVKPGCEVVEDQ